MGRAANLRHLIRRFGIIRSLLVAFYIFPFLLGERLTNGRLLKLPLLFPFHCKDHGYKFWARVGEFHYFLEEYEPLSVHAADGLISGGVAVDVGAYIGIHTIHFAKKARLVISIEPHPYHLKILLRNIKTNRLDNVIVVPAAASNQIGTAMLNRSGPCWTLQASQWYGPAPERWRQDSIGVATLTLETIFRKFGIKEVDLLKIDVEGAESLVLEGLGEYLKPEKVKALIVEIDPRNEEKVMKLCKDYKHTIKLEEYPLNTNYLLLP